MEESKSLLICGKCGYDQRKDSQDKKRLLEKVVVADYANILCRSCKMMLEEEISDVAARYLGD